MALIKCPECGKEVSDNCSQCIHCGYPLISYKCLINGKEYDFQKEFDLATVGTEDWLGAVGKIREKTFLTLVDGYNLASIMRDTKKVPPTFVPEYPLDPNMIKGVAQSGNSVTCPYCHSTNTRKISGASKAGSVAMFGVFGMGKASKQWHCNNCNSDF